MATSVASVLLVVPSFALACGGTFCDQPNPTPTNPDPPPMIVNQTAETVLFEVANGQVEAHIRIEYDPTSGAEKFAWLIPVPAVPEFEVGAELLFGAITSATNPVYDYDLDIDTDCPCNQPPPDSNGGLTGGDDGGVGPQFDAGGDGGGEPEVVLETTVGAFQATVLSGGTVQGVMDWLAANGYYQDPASAPILDEYLKEGHLFVALKLTNDADVGEIHPVVIRYAGSEPCVPLRLTRIAAEDDMAVRVIGLGHARLAPSNWSHVELNPWAFDWSDLSDYQDVIIRAIDEAPGGLGWITEYADEMPGFAPGFLVGSAWDETTFETIAPELVVDTLESQGLVDCNSFQCDYRHPLIRGLLAKYLPVPMGVDEADFYANLQGYVDQIDQQAWDGLGFAADMRERIIDPALRAEEMVFDNTYATRMFTRISPHEMLVDPMFHENEMLLDVESQRSLPVFRSCDRWRTVSLEGWPDLHLSPGAVWHSQSLPPALRIETIPPMGPPMIDTDFTSEIENGLADWEASVAWPGEQPCVAPDPDPDGGGIGVTAGQEGDEISRATCACAVPNASSIPGGAVASMMLFGLGLAFKRRRAR